MARKVRSGRKTMRRKKNTYRRKKNTYRRKKNTYRRKTMRRKTMRRMNGGAGADLNALWNAPKPWWNQEAKLQHRYTKWAAQNPLDQDPHPERMLMALPEARDNENVVNMWMEVSAPGYRGTEQLKRVLLFNFFKKLGMKIEQEIDSMWYRVRQVYSDPNGQARDIGWDGDGCDEELWDKGGVGASFLKEFREWEKEVEGREFHRQRREQQELRDLTVEEKDERERQHVKLIREGGKREKKERARWEEDYHARLEAKGRARAEEAERGATEWWNQAAYLDD